VNSFTVSIQNYRLTPHFSAISWTDME